MKTPDPNPDALHWLDPGVAEIDAVHWIPYMTNNELGVDTPKLTLDPTAPSRPDPDGAEDAQDQAGGSE